jgi:hypothetical protein
LSGNDVTVSFARTKVKVDAYSELVTGGGVEIQRKPISAPRTCIRVLLK